MREKYVITGKTALLGHNLPQKILPDQTIQFSLVRISQQ
jgi:hypothetical protein